MKRCKSYHRGHFAFPLRTSVEAVSAVAGRAGCAQGVALALSRTNVQIAAVVDEEPLGPSVAERAGETAPPCHTNGCARPCRRVRRVRHRAPSSVAPTGE